MAPGGGGFFFFLGGFFFTPDGLWAVLKTARTVCQWEVFDSLPAGRGRRRRSGRRSSSHRVRANCVVPHAASPPPFLPCFLPSPPSSPPSSPPLLPGSLAPFLSSSLPPFLSSSLPPCLPSSPPPCLLPPSPPPSLPPSSLLPPQRRIRKQGWSGPGGGGVADR